MVREGGKVTKVIVPIALDASARPLKGNGWTLELSPAWAMSAGLRKGDSILNRVK